MQSNVPIVEIPFRPIPFLELENHSKLPQASFENQTKCYVFVIKLNYNDFFILMKINSFHE